MGMVLDKYQGRYTVGMNQSRKQSTRRGKGGSGLGTHIMYNLVTQTLGGQIEAESRPNEGLRYTISFAMRKS